MHYNDLNNIKDIQKEIKMCPNRAAGAFYQSNANKIYTDMANPHHEAYECPVSFVGKVTA
jgi:hypothetical protein